MGMLVDGRWTEASFPTDEGGRFRRAPTRFRGQPAPEAGRYRLYVSYACPWAHRTLIARVLYGLEAAVEVVAVDPLMGAGGWAFGANGPDPDGAALLRDVYLRADPRFTGRVTVPVLWDRADQSIVSNESREILRSFGTALRPLHTRAADLCPPALREAIDAEIDENYGPINDGVYRAGFARSQAAYDEAVEALFAALDRKAAGLADRRFLLGDALTEADICLFTTLVRFDAVYVGHFKCNLRRTADYPSLSRYLREIYHLPGVAATCRFDEIKRHYYASHTAINPTGIVPRGPLLDLGDG